MPVFYFHYWDGFLLTEDTEGSELDDVWNAYIEAYETAEELAINLIRDHHNATRGRIDVVDELGQRVFHLAFSEVLGRGHTADAQQIDQLRGLRGHETERDPATATVGVAQERPRTLGDVLYAKSDAAPPEREWAALMRSIAAGDQLALHALYERSHRLVFTLIYRLVGKRETAQDLTIETFHDIWGSAPAYDPASGSVLGWIMTQARSRASCRRIERRSEGSHTGDRAPDWRRFPALRGVSAPQARLALRIAAESGGRPVAPAPRQWSEPRWEEVAQGIECKVFAADAEGHIVSMLVRLAPGASYPPHTHAGLHLLDGELWIDDTKFFPGDYNYGAPGKRDERVWSETGCICVLVTSTRDALH